MAVSNTNLHNYNHELVQCIEDLKRKREEVNRQIEQEEQDSEKIKREISLLQERLQRIKESLARKIHARSEYDKTIQETEGAYTKASGSLPSSPAASEEPQQLSLQHPLAAISAAVEFGFSLLSFSVLSCVVSFLISLGSACRAPLCLHLPILFLRCILSLSLSLAKCIYNSHLSLKDLCCIFLSHPLFLSFVLVFISVQILESAQTLLHVLKRESVHLGRRTASPTEVVRPPAAGQHLNGSHKLERRDAAAPVPPSQNR